jgi:1-acyl-sn-glycerol-3-phosphate acyltransferase
MKGRVMAAGEAHRAEASHGRATLLFYNLLYWPYLITSCAILFVPALGLFLLTAPFDPKRRLLARFTSAWGAHYLSRAPLAGTRVIGLEKIPRDQPCVVVANHQSMVDILAVFGTRVPMLWVSKVENFYAPFLGWNMALNRYIPLKRGRLRSIVRMVRTCLRRLAEGDHIFIFPEGTRSPDGQMIAFYDGAFRIARRAGVPVVPMVIEGTGDILPKGTFRISPRPVTVKILDPIHPSEVDGDHRRLRDLVRTRMMAELAALRGSPEAAKGGEVPLE